jgi:hypothetical protein
MYCHVFSNYGRSMDTGCFWVCTYYIQYSQLCDKWLEKKWQTRSTATAVSSFVLMSDQSLAGWHWHWSLDTDTTTSTDSCEIESACWQKWWLCGLVWLFCLNLIDASSLQVHKGFFLVMCWWWTPSSRFYKTMWANRFCILNYIESQSASLPIYANTNTTLMNEIHFVHLFCDD